MAATRLCRRLLERTESIALVMGKYIYNYAALAWLGDAPSIVCMKTFWVLCMESML